MNPNTFSGITAQQTNLVRTVLSGSEDFLLRPCDRDPESGRRRIAPLGNNEVQRFEVVWAEKPIECIRSMNRAIQRVDEPARFARYLRAAVDLELVMDREGARTNDRDHLGIPAYVTDGYTDLGFHPSIDGRRTRERIYVDKRGLRPQLLESKHEGVATLGQREAFGHCLAKLGQSLRDSVGFEEGRRHPHSDDETVLLSDRVEKRAVAARELAILFQLRMQEAGISSRIVKGVIRLYGLKARHAWNVAFEGGVCALVDTALAEDEGPFVLVGENLQKLYQQAAERYFRVYCPSPDSFHCYRVDTGRRDV